MLKEKLLEDLKESMKGKNVIRKNVVQMVRAAILQIAKEAKKRKDALEDYQKSGREDLIEQMNQEIKILNEYLPKQLTEEELTQKMQEIITELCATSIKDIGAVMKKAKETIGAAANGKAINEVAKKILNNC